MPISAADRKEHHCEMTTRLGLPAEGELEPGGQGTPPALDAKSALGIKVTS